MKRGKESGERVVRVLEDGTAVLEASFLKDLGLRPDDQIHVRVTTRKLRRGLLRIGVTEDEVETIAAMQLEPRENVERFLSTQGAMQRRAGRKARR